MFVFLRNAFHKRFNQALVLVTVDEQVAWPDVKFVHRFHSSNLDHQVSPNTLFLIFSWDLLS